MKFKKIFNIIFSPPPRSPSTFYRERKKALDKAKIMAMKYPNIVVTERGTGIKRNLYEQTLYEQRQAYKRLNALGYFKKKKR